MKVVLLAGGLGTRLSEETSVRPKPMVEIGGMPILWHIMKCYSAHGLDEFVICAGYKGYVIKEYFSTFFTRNSDFTIDMRKNEFTFHSTHSEPWRVTIIDTGEHTMTGGRIKRVADHLDGPFCLTYGDGVSDVNISELLSFHKREGGEVTLTAVQPAGRFGALALQHDSAVVGKFEEKPAGDGTYVNGGFFVCEPACIDRIADDTTIWEQAPLRTLADDGALRAYRHQGFWQPMDSLNDKHRLESMWASGKAPWTLKW
jgi:glucose-1-phosphate cytidylyltransferase